MNNLLANPTTLKYKEKEYIKHIEKERENGFADREIDRLHASISSVIERTKAFVDGGFYEKTKLYMADEAVDGHQVFLANDKNLMDYDSSIFFKDSEGKTYLVIDLGQGLSYNDWPSSLPVYETKAYIYPSEDFKSLSKVIFQYKRVNSLGTRHVREMRRIINPSPVISQPMKLEGLKVKGDLPKLQEELVVEDNVTADINNDIVLEYYTSNDGVNVWPDYPIIPQKPALISKLNDPNDLLDFRVQKRLVDQYRGDLKKVYKSLAHRFHIMELNKRGTNFKMLADF